MSERFNGTIEEFADVDIPLASVDAEDFRPFATKLVEQFFPGCSISGIGLFTVAPGQIHPVHTDVQPEEWVTRVHIPLSTNRHCVATMPDGPHEMVVGKAYKFNTLAPHAVSNGGLTPRVHLVFEVRK